jgi:hypothetical protein
VRDEGVGALIISFNNLRRKQMTNMTLDQSKKRTVLALHPNPKKASFSFGAMSGILRLLLTTLQQLERRISGYN